MAITQQQSQAVRRIWILCTFPQYFDGFLQSGVIAQVCSGKRVVGENLSLAVHLIHLRDFSPFAYKNIDDTPFGGGAGMIMRPDIVYDALEQGVVVQGGYDPKEWKKQLRIIFPSPRGQVWHHQVAENFSCSMVSDDRDLVFLCGRYEGVDERFLDQYVDEYYSLGDYILSGGEIAVMTILDSSLRLLPGALGNQESLAEESFHSDLLEYPLYTRPREFQNISVPEVYLSGHHKQIKKYQQEQRAVMTQKYRPDLWQKFVRKQSKKQK